MGNATSDRSGSQQSSRRAASDMANEITIIGEQQRETLALLRQLIEMLLPRADQDKPKLEDLIAVLVGQQQHMLRILRQLSLDMEALLGRRREDGNGRPRGHPLGDGQARP
jgi:hypothetical protein